MAQRFRVFTEHEVLRLPDPTWQIQKVLPEGGFAVLFGRSGTGKTFVALDLALSIAEGIDWLTYFETIPGPVIYIVGEGRGGLKFRLKAWRTTHPELEQMPVNFVLEPIDMLDQASVSNFLKRLPYPPSLVVIDTLERNFVGNPNETEDMAKFVWNVDHIRHETEATTLVVHHVGYSEEAQDRIKGNSTLENAADTMLLLKKQSNSIVLTCEKQKDGDPFRPIELQLTPIALSETTDSAIVLPVEKTGRIIPGSKQKKFR